MRVKLRRALLNTNYYANNGKFFSRCCSDVFPRQVATDRVIRFIHAQLVECR